MRFAMWRGRGLALRAAMAAVASAAGLLGAPALHSVRADEVEEIKQLEKTAESARPAQAVKKAAPQPAPKAIPATAAAETKPAVPARPAQALKKAAPQPAPQVLPVPAAAETKPAVPAPAAPATNVAEITFSTLPQALGEIERLNGVIRALQLENRREKLNAHYNMGCVYKVCGQPQRAEQEFLKALEIDPDDAGTHYNLGILYEDSLHNRTKAKLHYQRFVELAPQDPDAGNVQAWLMSLK